MSFFFSLFQRVVMACRADLLLFVPFLMFYFCFHTVSVVVPLFVLTDVKITLFQFILFAFVWSLELFIKCLVMMWVYYQDFSVAFQRVRSQFAKIFMALMIVFCPLFLLMMVVMRGLGTSFVGFQLLLLIGVIILLVPVILLTHFLPVVYLVRRVSLKVGFNAVMALFESHLNRGIYYVLFIMFISIISMFALLILSHIPIVGTSILSILFQGMMGTIMAIFTLKFYLHIIVEDVQESE